MLGDDVVDSALAAAKKDFLLERLNKRNKERLNYLDSKSEQRNKEQVELEGADYFSQSFTEQVHSIQIRINDICQNNTKKTTEGDVSSDLSRQFAEITLDIQALQQYLTTSTMFLTEFKIKSCQAVLNELTATSEAARLKLLPKKKFGFSGRKITPKTTVNPRLNGSDLTDTDNKAALSAKNSAFTWTLSNRQYEHILLVADDVNGKDITISNLKTCFIELQGYPGSVQISKAVNCTLLCGPISRSLFAEYCENVNFAIACQQMRLHSSTRCRVFLHVTCRAIIEDCQQIEVGTYNYSYETIEEEFKKAGLDKSLNNYRDVADFNWLSPDVPSPNWKLKTDANYPNWLDLREKFIKNLGSKNL